MLPVAVPTHVVKQHRKAQRQLRVKDLIGTDSSECFLPATDSEYSRTPGENAAHARNGAAVAQKRNQGVWRLNHLSGFHAARMPDPVGGIVGHATPAVPVLGGAVEDLRIADVVQNSAPAPSVCVASTRRRRRERPDTRRRHDGYRGFATRWRPDSDDSGARSTSLCRAALLPIVSRSPCSRRSSHRPRAAVPNPRGSARARS